MDEIWIDLEEDYRYKISNTGKLKRNDGFVPKCAFDKDGYLTLHTIKGYFRVHRLVAKYFVKNNDIINNTDVHHKDHNKLNNNYLNLEWINRSEHSKDIVTNKHRLETLKVKK